MNRLSARLRLLSLGLAVLATWGCEEDLISVESGARSSLSVRVYVDANGNGTFDAGDVAVADVTVTAAGPETRTGTTDAQGSASFQDLVPGSYLVSMSGDVPSGAVLATATRPVVVAPFGGASLQAEFRFAFNPGTLRGTVFRDDDASGDFDPAEDLVAPGIPVTIFQGAAASGDPLLELTTDEEGSFSAALRPGTYTVEVSPLESMEIVGGTTRTVALTAGATTDVPFEFTGTLLIDIAAARALADGRTVTVEGVVTWQSAFDTRVIFLQDETGGISVFDASRPALATGDRIRVTGTKGSFRGELQISPVTAREVIAHPGEPDPRAVTAAEINAGSFQGELVTLDATVESVDVRSFNNQFVVLTDAEGNDFAVFADSRTGVLPEAWQVGEVYAVTGVLGTDDREALPHRIEVRSPEDVRRGGSVLSIAEARTLVGETVTVEGVVTWQEPFGSGRVYFIQDATGGISTFHSGAPALQRGDLVRLRGTIGAFRGEVQFASVASLTVLANVPVPSPRGVTAAEINAGEFQGELVTITGTVSAVEELAFGNQRVTLTDLAGGTFSVFVDSRIGVSASAWTVGETVRLTGVLGTDDRDALPHRLEIRDAADRVVASAGVLSVAEARSRAGETVTVEGVVTFQESWNKRVYFLQDETGGVSTFHTGAPDLARGTRVRVTGTVAAFNGEVQLSPVSALTVLDTPGEPAPLAVSGAQINAGQFQGQLARITGTVTEVDVVNSFGTHVVSLGDGSGTVFTVFVDNRTGVAPEAWTVGSRYTVTGVLGFDSRNTPAARLEVRDASDIQAES